MKKILIGNEINGLKVKSTIFYGSINSEVIFIFYQIIQIKYAFGNSRIN